MEHKVDEDSRDDPSDERKQDCAHAQDVGTDLHPLSQAAENSAHYFAPVFIVMISIEFFHTVCIIFPPDPLSFLREGMPG